VPGAIKRRRWLWFYSSGTHRREDFPCFLCAGQGKTVEMEGFFHGNEKKNLYHIVVIMIEGKTINLSQSPWRFS
jgi:hypothetical protein